MITAIAPQRVAWVWPEAEPQLRRAVARMHERSTHDVLMQLVAGMAQLWHITENGSDAWAVTEIVPYPRCQVAFASFLGGTLQRTSVAEMRGALRHWAIQHHADEIRIVGRPGWAKLFPEFHRLTVFTQCLPSRS